MTEEIKSTKGACPTCEADRNAKVVGQHYQGWSDDESGIDGGTTYRILKCLGCDEVYFQSEVWFSENLDYRYNAATNDHEPYMPTEKSHWPKSHARKRPTWRLKLRSVDGQLANLLEEVYSAYDEELYVLSAIGVRTTFDRASEVLTIEPTLPFEKKLKELVSSGNIGEAERVILGALTDAGSAAAHRGWRPTKEELDVMLDALEGFLSRSFVVSGEAQKLLQSVPAKPKAKKPNKSPPKK